MSTDSDSLLTGLQNQPHYPELSAVHQTHASEEVDVAAVAASDLLNPTPAFCQGIGEVATHSIPSIPERSDASMAECPQQRESDLEAQKASEGPRCSPASTIASKALLGPEDTTEMAVKALSNLNEYPANARESSDLSELNPPQSRTIERTSPDVSEPTSEFLEPAGPVCLLGGVGKDTKIIRSELILLISKHVREENPPLITAQELGSALQYFYKNHAQPPEKEGHLYENIRGSTIQGLILGALRDETLVEDCKILEIYEKVDRCFGARGWTPRIRIRTAQDDSAIADMESYRRSQNTNESNFIALESTTPGKHSLDQSSQTTMPPKRPRHALEVSQEERSQSLVSSHDISEPPELPESQGNSSDKPICPVCKCEVTRIEKHLTYIHFPLIIYVCTVNEAGSQCGHKSTNECTFYLNGGHVLNNHQVYYTSSATHETCSLKPFVIKDMWHDVCPFCIEHKRLGNRKAFIQHLIDHANKKYETHTFNDRCTKDCVDWWYNSCCIPSEYRGKNKTMKNKKSRQSHQDHKHHRDTPSRDDDEDDDHHNPQPPPPGSGKDSSSSLTKPGNGQGTSSSQPSRLRISGHNSNSSYLCASLNEHISTPSALPKPLSIKLYRECFKFIRELGRGGFGTVDEVVNKVTNKTYARKRIPLDFTAKRSAEVEILSKLRHRHIVNLADFVVTSTQLWLFMLPVAESNLASYLSGDSRGGVDCELFGKWEGCLASAVTYLHETGLTHGDIKPQNILVTSGLDLYLTDFGSARAKYLDKGLRNRTKPRIPMTPKYCAPETSYHKFADQKWDVRAAADIFSLGCVWAEMETISTGFSLLAFEDFRSAGSGYNSYQANLPRTYCWIDFLYVVQESQPNISKKWRYVSQTLHIVKKMLRFDPDMRPKAGELSVDFHCGCLPTVSHCYLREERQLSPSNQEIFGHQQLAVQHRFDEGQVGFTLPIKVVPSIQWISSPGNLRSIIPHDTRYNECTDTCNCFYWQVALATLAAFRFKSQVDKNQSLQLVHQTAKMYLLNRSLVAYDDFEDDRSQFDFRQANLHPAISRGCNVDRPADSKTTFRESSQNLFVLRSLCFDRYLPSHPAISMLSLTDYFREITPPTSDEDTFKFWKSAFFLFDAGWNISERLSHTGWLSNVKPANVLIMRSKTTSPYDWTFTIGGLGTSYIDFRAEDCKEDGRKICDTSVCMWHSLLTKGSQRGDSRKTHDVWSLGCIFVECVAWTIGGSGATREVDFTIPGFGAGSDFASCEYSIESKAQTSRERLLRIVLDVPESVTKSIAKNIVVPMFDAPDRKFSWESLRVKATSLLDTFWKDCKKEVTKATDPRLPLVPSRDKGTLNWSTHGQQSMCSATSCSNKTEIFDHHPDLMDVDINSNISTSPTGSSDPIERYLRDKSDYRVMVLASCLPYAGRDACKELQEIYFQNLVDRLAKF